MVASVIEELSPKDQRSKLLREKLAIIQEAQVSAVSAGFATASNLQLLRQDALLRNFGFQPQVLSTVRTPPLEGPHLLGPDAKELQNRVGPSGKLTEWQAHPWHLSRNPKRPRQPRKWHHLQGRTSPGPLSLIILVHLLPLLYREMWRRSSRFVLAPAGEPAIDPTQINAARLKRLLQLPQPVSIDGVQVGARRIVKESAGHLPGHQHCRGRGGHHFPSQTSADPSVHQLPDQEQPGRPPAGHGCLAVEGGHRAGHQRDIPQVLQPTVSGPQEDGRSSSGVRPFHSQPPHGSSTLQDGNAAIRPFSHQKSRVNSVHRHPRCISTCPVAPSRPEVSAICGQQASLPIHLPTLWIGNITSRVHQALTTNRSAVKAARCEATRLFRRLADPCRYSRTGATACPDDHQCASVSRLDHKLQEVTPYSKSGLPVHRDAVQHSAIHSGAPTEDVSQSPVCSSTLDDQPKHHSSRSAQITGHVSVHGFTGTTGKTPSSSGPVVGRYSIVPEYRELDRPDHSSSVGAVRGGLVGISSSPARSSPHH